MRRASPHGSPLSEGRHEPRSALSAPPSSRACVLNSFVQLYAQISAIIPYVVVAPFYFVVKKVDFETFNQAADAFTRRGGSEALPPCARRGEAQNFRHGTGVRALWNVVRGLHQTLMRAEGPTEAHS